LSAFGIVRCNPVRSRRLQMPHPSSSFTSSNQNPESDTNPLDEYMVLIDASHRRHNGGGRGETKESLRSLPHRRLATTPASAARGGTPSIANALRESASSRLLLRRQLIPRVCQSSSRITHIMTTKGRVRLSISNRAESRSSISNPCGKPCGSPIYQGRGVD